MERMGILELMHPALDSVVSFKICTLPKSQGSESGINVARKREVEDWDRYTRADVTSGFGDGFFWKSPQYHFLDTFGRALYGE